MQTVPVETMAMIMLVIIWAGVALLRGKCCRMCGYPEKHCKCYHP